MIRCPASRNSLMSIFIDDTSVRGVECLEEEPRSTPATARVLRQPVIEVNPRELAVAEDVILRLEAARLVEGARDHVGGSGGFDRLVGERRAARGAEGAGDAGPAFEGARCSPFP